ncbi:MAG: hypothetical protein M3347_14915 [Armatimonadota bacterium]|nr:hypothetical protein [Armatimonadota bacterium]
MDYKDLKLMRDSFEKSAAKGTLTSEWHRIHNELKENPTSQTIFRELATTEQGRENLAIMRQEWAKHEMAAPFDFIFESEGESPQPKSN